MTRANWLKCSVIAFFAFALVARAAWSGAYSSGFEPYPNAKHFPMRSCSLERSSKIGQDYACRSKNDFSSIKIFAQNDAAQTVQLEVRRNGSLKARVKLDFVNWLDYALEGDLNRDGTPDYLIVEPSGGNGLASEYCLAIFILSSRTGYVVTQLNTMGFDPSDLLLLASNQLSLVHTWFVSAEEPTPDGKYHNYWVYHFFKVRDTKLVLESGRKPIWIQYKLRHNHTPTRLVSRGQKTRWWNKQKQPFFWR
jgi:hypothetical protein